LLDALQDRPDIPSKWRIAHPVRKLKASDIPDFKSLKELRRAGWAIFSTTYKDH